MIKPFGMAAALAATCMINATMTHSPASAAPYQLGSCNVTQQAPKNPCQNVRGKRATGVHPGTEHQDCTDAKANARTNLVNSLKGNVQQCSHYIQCNNACRVIQK